MVCVVVMKYLCLVSIGEDLPTDTHTHNEPNTKSASIERKNHSLSDQNTLFAIYVYAYFIRCIVSALLLTIILLVVQFIRFWIIEHLDGCNVRHKIFRGSAARCIYDLICPNEPETVYIGFKVRQNYAVITMGLLFASAIETSLRTRTTSIIFRSLQISNKILLLLKWVLVHAL